uniref:RNA polymerase factor sigma-32 n=1 Tax=Pararhizobium sp. IMCC3301 TaxID=3067904 RepID=UPI0027413FC8|nr:RNA polymerase factor sigma-32 [Pararhizobium sp. IMCC3301]
MSDDHTARRTFMRTAMKAPYLERDEEHQLAVRWKEAGDQEALHKLTSAHMRLVISFAAKFRYYGLSMSDLIQEGHVGLLEAAARFDPQREVRFSTYATWWIRASIQDHILRNWSIVRGGTSSAQKSLFFNLRRLRAKLTAANGGVPTHETFTEIANAIGVSVKDVATMNSRLSGPDMSLNAPLTESDGGSADRQDFLVDERPNQGETVPEAMDQERRSKWLKSAMSVLSEREMRIVRDRRLSEDGATLESLGITLGISKERVRQIECRALEKLKVALVESQPAGFM